MDHDDWKVEEGARMTRDQARAAFAEAGLTYSALSNEALKDLWKRIDECMKASGCIGGTYRMRRTATLRNGPGGRYAELRCRSHHFDDREAVTFNSDGFIGFAGWADDTNVRPIIEAFADWIEAYRPAVGNVREMRSPEGVRL